MEVCKRVAAGLVMVYLTGCEVGGTASEDNNPPVIEGSPSTRVLVDENYSFTPTASDADGDPLSFSIVNLPSWCSFNESTGQLSGTPDANDLGVYQEILISVSDGQASRSLSAFSLSVTQSGANSPPLINGSPTTSVEVGEVYSFTPSASDADGDTLSFSISNVPSWSSFDTMTGRLAGTPGADDTGSYQNIVISVSDGLASTSLPPFTLSVIEAGANNSPRISGTPATSIEAGEHYSFTPSASDADSDTLSFSISNAPSWSSFDATTGRLAGTPGADDTGSYQNIVIAVSDGLASASLPPFTLTVVEAGANSPPLISGMPATSVEVGGLYTFIPDATDEDNDTLIFEITNLPAWCRFDSATGALTGTPGVDDVGNYQDIVISVSDGTDNAALTAFSISVQASTPGGSDTAPRLNFSDLISGPGTGLGDGLGSGVVVTVWGQFLGASQGTSSIEYCDSTATCRGGHVYYWKNADGALPGGPANLYRSHRMQEIAFSIPDSAAGAGTIRVTVGSDTSTLPFTVRPGGIYHVKSSGNDPAGDGSFANPWASVDQALSQIEAPGSTLYVHDSIVSDANPHRAIYWNKTVASSGLSNQFGIVAYPGSQPSAVGYSGFRNYTTEGQVVSKYAVYASECDEDSQGQPINCAVTPSLNLSYGIQTSAYGRAVGNAITDRPGGCADGQQGAISGNALSARDRVSGYQILGNEIYDYGCTGSTKFHHTTYLSIRSGDANLQLDPWRFGWNYLHDNHTKNGIHQYDENNSGTLCGSPNGTVIINDNVIINQSGAGISIGANCPWTNDFKVYNNILVNVGLAFDWDGVDPNTTNGPNTSGISVNDGGLMGSVEIYNNSIHTWNNDDQANDTQACLGLQGTGDNVSIIWNDNVCYTNKDKPFVAAGCCGAEVQLDNVIGDNNLWYYSGNSPVNAIPPAWDTAALTQDPLLSIVTATLVVGENSPLIGRSSYGRLTHDIYGAMRSTLSEIGAVQFNQ